MPRKAGVPDWHPHQLQLRHAKATEIRREAGLDAARAVLGHRTPKVTEALWFAKMWSRYQQPGRVHLRRVHYRIVSDNSPILTPRNKSKITGQPYANTEECWQLLNRASRDARYLGLVPPERIVDHRNPKPELHAPETQSARETGWEVEELPMWAPPFVRLSDGDLGSSGMLELPSVTVSGYDYTTGDQPVHVEFWIEKTTMNDVLVPIREELHVNLVAGNGFQSVSGVVELLKRLARLPPGKPTRIGYFSDFDPAGARMPPAVARIVEFYIDRYAPGANIKLVPVVLTPQQVIAYRLPRIPIRSIRSYSAKD